MNIWISKIMMGANLYRELLPAMIAIAAIALFEGHRINILRAVLAELFCFYACCLFGLVFLPLPTLTEAALLTYRAQLIPFYFVYDIATKPCTSAVLGVLFNIAMTVPFGMYLRYSHNFTAKQAVLASLALTLFIEFGQFTGFFGIYHGSYRLFDMDDILTNVLGGYLGFVLVRFAEKYVPTLQHFDLGHEKTEASPVYTQAAPIFTNLVKPRFL